MANVYKDGVADGRQSEDPNLAPSRFRPVYRQLTDAEKALHDQIKAKAEELEQLMTSVPSGANKERPRYRALALTALETAVMWSVKELTS